MVTTDTLGGLKTRLLFSIVLVTLKMLGAVLHRYRSFLYSVGLLLTILIPISIFFSQQPDFIFANQNNHASLEVLAGETLVSQSELETEYESLQKVYDTSLPSIDVLINLIRISAALSLSDDTQKYEQELRSIAPNHSHFSTFPN